MAIISIPALATAVVQPADTAMAQPMAGGLGRSDSLLGEVVRELMKVNVQLEAIQSKASFIEARSDTYSAHSHDCRRHREQMKKTHPETWRRHRGQMKGDWRRHQDV